MPGKNLICQRHQHSTCLATTCRKVSCAAGGKTDGDDAAQILKAAWRETRSSVMRGNGVAEFYFRQYLFACQARLLFKLNRPTEVTYQQLFCLLSIPKGLASFWADIQLHSLALQACLRLTCKGMKCSMSPAESISFVVLQLKLLSSYFSCTPACKMQLSPSSSRRLNFALQREKTLSNFLSNFVVVFIFYALAYVTPILHWQHGSGLHEQDQ